MRNPLKNSYQELPERFYQSAKPYGASDPKIIIYNRQLADELLLSIEESELAAVLSGNKILDDSKPVAIAYAGHQFGHFVPSLGDGRAILLGDINGFDLQLKGSGRTFFSRNGDGKAALGPVLREYLVSEFMHKMQVPTTRSLAAVLTGDPVYREEVKPGAILTRVASSHLRIGTFEYFASRGDREGLELLTNYAIKKHYPMITSPMEFFKEVAKKQAKLIAKWMGLGFIHGVMNTDNVSIAGETLDYGPCAFMDYYKKDQVYSFIDRNGRYAYNNQANIAVWNLSRLASCLVPLIDSDEKKAISILEEELHQLPKIFESETALIFNQKMGLGSVQEGDSVLHKLWFDYLETERLDFTNSFLKLNSDLESFSPTDSFIHFKSRFIERKKGAITSNVNPVYIPRNHLIEKAIKLAEQGDFTYFHGLHEILSTPFQVKEGKEEFALAPQENEVVKNTFCGT
jgi:serine/tyrosine/threonine adenylyltransferase